MQQEIHRRLRALPAVHEVVSRLEEQTEFSPFMTNERWLLRLTQCVRQVLQGARETIYHNHSGSFEEFEATLWPWIVNEVLKTLSRTESSLRRVINATGVVLHTNCGRALLAPDVARFVAEQAERYSNLELTIETGERGSRYTHVEELLCRLTGAEAAMVVNNNAAAVLLMMNTFALGKEVIVSRGELVEVGGSFRIPEVLKAGGAKLVEVGSTNKTWLKDYEAVIGPDTALLLKVHTSNYRVEGFTHAVSGAELVELGERLGVPVMEDLGSGSFFDGTSLGFPPEPTIKQTVKAGLSLVSFSGDKLLGGPQAGILVGKKSFVQRLRTNQLTRALRVDKLTLAALEATLRLYDNGGIEDIPVWRMLSAPLDTLHTAALELVTALQANPNIAVELQEDVSQVGGGAWPTVKLPTWVCAIRPKQGDIMDLEKFLRLGPIAILSRIHKDRVLIDVRTLLSGDFEEIIQRLGEWGEEVS
ncbi:L-seryl-tRNA(Sec) selenium transferase [Desulfosporosinus sp.]|uniref:L-seryl-tRNA(Sec) selenium transferase n=1 Tax=Desulfosporosinus sp. TaxID=157907 RepID=UPI000E9B435D|nr:L-seryl-tRNA(Sec) selenium transferase [Desulfosporosinus sp.]MBC2721420.1 L-seryl-tRNA(Sec) selenium transferase [Desulfosporosinus sp.]MBC2728891.1 L-seryl-tRNA(Sec) selenium transferase [Desulfosporosinus sp.]HBV85978.1 L-seryl-tRNA(Sec) selenium transferase [Desulfosporosinus sp.]